MKTLISGAIGVLIGAAIVYGGFVLLSHQTTQPAPLTGSSSGTDHYNLENFYNGLTYTTINGTPGNSSSTPTTSLPTLASVGHLTIGVGQTTENASTTAITSAKARVVVQLEQTTPLAGVTCNTTINASSSEAVSVYYASSTNTSLNGFKITVANAPVTNPFCFSYGVVGD